MSASLFFIRHASTALAGTFCGSSNPPLDALGVSQAVALVDRLRHEQFAAVYTSDLTRALSTASLLADAHHAALHHRPALREIHFGDWEALTWAAIEKRDPAYSTRWVTEFPALPTPGGEPIASFRRRVVDELQTLRAAAREGESIAIVTHAGVLRVLLEEFAHCSPHHAWERTRDYTTVIRCTQKSATGTLTIHAT